MGFWLKNFSSLHERVRLQLKECLDSGFLPSWLARGRTLLLQKDKSKGNVIGNLFVWGNPTGDSFCDMLKALVNCVEPISLIYHLMTNICVMSPDLNGICANFGH